MDVSVDPTVFAIDVSIGIVIMTLAVLVVRELLKVGYPVDHDRRFPVMRMLGSVLIASTVVRFLSAVAFLLDLDASDALVERLVSIAGLALRVFVLGGLAHTWIELKKRP